MLANLHFLLCPVNLSYGVEVEENFFFENKNEPGKSAEIKETNGIRVLKKNFKLIAGCYTAFAMQRSLLEMQ